MKTILLVLAMLAGSFSAIASMTISGTRIIFPQAKKEVNIWTNNNGTKPVSVRVWIDNDSQTTNLNDARISFIVIPSVYRLEVGKGQDVRLSYNGMALPQNKESVLWLNMSENPLPSTSSPDKQQFALAFLTKVKIFYRRDALPESNSANERKKLEWQAVSDPVNGVGIKLNNTKPYYFIL
ncbi:fimbrial biogenesis chaperone [Izhakiella capsodis]|nr:fimbria/pilus periplasmic chaperone [Izhakiella capsodis]